MKYERRFRISERGSPPALYRAVRAFAPSAARVGDISMAVRPGDTFKLIKLGMLVALCRGCGLRHSKLGDPGTYGYVVLRKYGPRDLALCELLLVHELSGRRVTLDERRDESGRLILTRQVVGHLGDFAEVHHRIVISTDARRNLETAGFQGLDFREVTTSVEEMPREVTGAFYWELRTDITLPKLANADKLMCYGRETPEPFTGDYTKMVFIDDPVFAGGEMHYRRKELQALGPFDVAQTFENLWIPQRSFVISQRFYQLLLSQNVSLTVEPVRLDEQ